MNMIRNDVVVHIIETLADEVLQSLQEAIHQLEGVISVGHAPDRRHLLEVAFNDAVIKPLQILEFVKSRGVHAQLVGM